MLLLKPPSSIDYHAGSSSLLEDAPSYRLRLIAKLLPALVGRYRPLLLVALFACIVPGDGSVLISQYRLLIQRWSVVSFHDLRLQAPVLPDSVYRLSDWRLSLRPYVTLPVL